MIEYNGICEAFKSMHYKEMVVRVITVFFLVFLSLTAAADTLTGKVVKITDGDTLYVLHANYEQHKIRLAGIDAPERKQAYGLASRKHLASIVTGKKVTVGQVQSRLGLLLAALADVNSADGNSDGKENTRHSAS